MADQKLQKNAATDKSGSGKKREEELEKKLLKIRETGEEEKYKNLAQQLNLPYSDLISIPIDTDTLSLLSKEDAYSANIAVVLKKSSEIVVVTIDPNNPATQKVISRLSNSYKVSIVLTNPKSLQRILKRYQTITGGGEVFEIGAIEIKEKELSQFENSIKNIADIKSHIKKLSATSLLELVLAGALKTEASDIHIEPRLKEIQLRYRLDGLLHDITSLDKLSYEKILNRIKVLSKMKVNIHNTRQDGRLTIRQEPA